jgi:hypothetical protein
VAIGQPEQSHTRTERELTHRRKRQRPISDHRDGAGPIDERHRFGFGSVTERDERGAHIQACDQQRKEDRAVADERHHDSAAPDAEAAERSLDRCALRREVGECRRCAGWKELHRDGTCPVATDAFKLFADGAD